MSSPRVVWMGVSISTMVENQVLDLCCNMSVLHAVLQAT